VIKRGSKLSKTGYALLTAILAINIFTILLLKARFMWERELMRDLEEELLFRARQYVMAIEFYRKKNPNMFPQSLDILFEKKFLRKRYLDPMTESGEWNVLMRPGTTGAGATKLLVVPESMLDEYISQAMIVGVASASCEEGYRVYRKQKKYCKWAVYLGDEADKEMPELKFVTSSEEEEDSKSDKDDKSDSGDKGDRGDRGDRDDRGRGDRDGRGGDGRGGSGPRDDSSGRGR
jgi:hypothetical protein